MAGCSLSSYCPGNVEQVIKYLQGFYPDLTVLQQCCGKPTRLIGQEAEFEKRFKRLNDSILACEVDVMITACQGCFSVMSKSADYVTKSLWEVFAELGLPEGNQQKGQKSRVIFAIHDSCPTREETKIWQAVRVIVAKLGYQVQEGDFVCDQTRCCGMGGMCALSNPELAQLMMQKRVEQLQALPIITYCAACRSAMIQGGAQAWHLLDLIFGDVVLQPDNCPRNVLASPLNAWLNRYKSKQLIKKSKRKHVKTKKIIAFGLIVGAVLITSYATGITNHLQSVALLQTYFQDLGLWGYLLFILISIATAVFMLPGQFLAIVAGVVYGGIIGSILTVIGATIGSGIAFLLGKYFFRAYIVEKFATNSLFKKIEQGVADHGVSFLILTRLVPVFPFAIQCYAYALTPMKFRTFIGVTFITIIPGSVMYVYLAEEISTNGFSAQLLGLFTITGSLLFLLSFIPKQIARRKQIKL